MFNWGGLTAERLRPWLSWWDTRQHACRHGAKRCLRVLYLYSQAPEREQGTLAKFELLRPKSPPHHSDTHPQTIPHILQQGQFLWSPFLFKSPHTTSCLPKACCHIIMQNSFNPTLKIPIVFNSHKHVLKSKTIVSSESHSNFLIVTPVKSK